MAVLGLDQSDDDYLLQVLHCSDQEGGINAVDDAPAFSAVLNHFRDQMPGNTLTLSSGDAWIPGPFFSTAADFSMGAILGDRGVGRADIVVLNEMDFQAACFGNHEFDTGTGTVRDNILPDYDYPGCLFPYMSCAR